MIIIQLMGGLGNQMQQYALYQKFLTLGIPAKLDASWFDDTDAQQYRYAKRKFELKFFRDLPMDLAAPEEVKALTGGSSFAAKVLRKTGLRKNKIFRESVMYHENIFDLRDAYISGYFACNRYYADILPKLRKLFVFPDAGTEEVAAENRRIEEAILADKAAGVLTASVHLRRGDYLAPENTGLYGGICTPAYYEGCAQYVKELAGAARPVHFYLFSDDPVYARTLHFGDAGDINTVVDINRGDDALLDMRLMSLCRVNVCANSTFSFWAARLNGQEGAVHVRPSVHRNNQVAPPAEMHRLWGDWILADREGNIV